MSDPVQQQAHWNAHCATYGFRPEEWGLVIRWNKANYKLQDIRPRGLYRHIEALRIWDQKVFTLPTVGVRKKLGPRPREDVLKELLGCYAALEQLGYIDDNLALVLKQFNGRPQVKPQAKRLLQQRNRLCRELGNELTFAELWTETGPTTGTLPWDGQAW